MDAPADRPAVRVDDKRSKALADWCTEVLHFEHDPFEAARKVCRRLGAHVVKNRTEFGFWAPEILEKRVSPHDVYLEILTPTDEMNLSAGYVEMRFRRQLLPMHKSSEFLWVSVEGLTAGRRERVGCFYQVKYQTGDGKWGKIPDYLAYSLPYGVFAPAELYDIGHLQANRADADYYRALRKQYGKDAIPRRPVAKNILQIHVPTGSAGGTLASLARRYEEIGAKVADGQPLLPAEEAYIHYDAVQLMPVEPTIVFEAGPPFFHDSELDPVADEVLVALRRPNTTNWGYDITLSGMAAVNPAILETGRPDELVDLAAALHNFPGEPIRLIFDVVYGHADNQAVDLINRHFFTGPNMYGQDVNFRHPVVRAILLESQRRKVNFGADGVRVDGAQDFKWWNTDTQELLHDDEFLQEMSDVVQEIAGFSYRPWMIFEDGRPWPREDWELASTYRTVMQNQGSPLNPDPNPDVFQWGPLTFAHNTPFRYTFWAAKWWRVQEMAMIGANWISGCANHDTLRRGYQVDPEAGVNSRLGTTLLDVLDTAYDHAAASMLTYAVLPGVPMDFINASMRASWGFIRNTDDRYSVKVMSEEANFLTWQVNDLYYSRPGNFERLKSLGFDDLEELRRFMKVLVTSVDATDYKLDYMASMLNAVDPPLQGPQPVTPAALKGIARAFFDDLHDYCNVSFSYSEVSQLQITYNAFLREFRRQRPWLRNNFGPDDFIDRRKPANSSMVYFALRTSPEHDEQIMFIGNMEGLPAEIHLFDLPVPHLERQGWTNVQATPGLWVDNFEKPFTLYDNQAILLTRRTDPG